MSESLDQIAAESIIGAETVDVIGQVQGDQAAATGSFSVNTSSSLSRQLFVEQFTSLRSEIEQRINLRQQLIALTLVVAGTFLTIGVQPGESWVVLLFYPLLAMFMAAAWEHNDLRIGQINWYIQSVIEQHLGDLGPGWEYFRRQAFRSASQRRNLRTGNIPQVPEAHGLRGVPGLIAISTRGLYLGTQALAVVVATVRFGVEHLQSQTWDALIQEIGFPIKELDQAKVLGFLIVLVLNIGIISYTGVLLRHSRVRMAPQSPQEPQTSLSSAASTASGQR